jgi:hypothetical protein
MATGWPDLTHDQAALLRKELNLFSLGFFGTRESQIDSAERMMNIIEHFLAQLPIEERRRFLNELPLSLHVFIDPAIRVAKHFSLAELIVTTLEQRKFTIMRGAWQAEAIG